MCMWKRMNGIIIVILFIYLLPSLLALSCHDVSLPCVTIPKCSSPSRAAINVQQLSTGLGTSKSSTTATLCYTAQTLNLQIEARNQVYSPKDLYGSCNDAVYMLDVIELFIGECSSPSSYCNVAGDTYCYSEIDTSPYNKIFESGIYTPYLNHTGVVNTLIDCEGSHIQHSTTTLQEDNIWSVKLAIPWELVYNPAGCPAGAKEAALRSKATSSGNGKLNQVKEGSVFRGNIYRVNELIATDQCSSSTCEYVSWTPTYSNPPAFHEPTKFGYFILQ